MAEIHMDPGWREHFSASLEHLAHEIGRAVLDDMKRGCPVDTGRLVESLDYEVYGADAGYVTRVGSRDVEYSTYVELGTAAHTISSHGDYPLRNRETGQTFGRTVHHPGTPAQPYMRPALYRKRG